MHCNSGGNAHDAVNCDARSFCGSHCWGSFPPSRTKSIWFYPALTDSNSPSPVKKPLKLIQTTYLASDKKEKRKVKSKWTVFKPEALWCYLHLQLIVQYYIQVFLFLHQISQCGCLQGLVITWTAHLNSSLFWKSKYLPTSGLHTSIPFLSCPDGPNSERENAAGCIFKATCYSAGYCYHSPYYSCLFIDPVHIFWE